MKLSDEFWMSLAVLMLSCGIITYYGLVETGFPVIIRAIIGVGVESTVLALVCISEWKWRQR